MKTQEMRELKAEDLQQKVDEARKELFEARIKKAQQQLENTALLGELKNRIARLKTVQREQQLAKASK